MGGAVSQFDDTNWQEADGGLRTARQTLDQRPPLESYTILYLHKRSLLANQRDFVVTDEQSNLWYTIQPTPSTLAGFDVLDGSGSASDPRYLLRVTVDLARRDWIVYRYQHPAFAGQLPDATMETDNKNQKLYKICCVTVSWSRYMAVAAHFGPPSGEQLMQYQQQQQSYHNNADSSDDELFVSANQISSRMRERSLVSSNSSSQSEGSVDQLSSKSGNDSISNAATKKSDETPQNDSAAMDPPNHHLDDGSNCDDSEHKDDPVDRNYTDQPLSEAVSMMSSTTPTHSLADDLASDSSLSQQQQQEIPTVRSQPDDATSATTSDAATNAELQASVSMPELGGTSLTDSKSARLRSWLRHTSESFHHSIQKRRKNQQHHLTENPLLGVVHLDQPLLLCQEIYTKLIGNHQTSRLSRSKVLKLLKQDMEQHLRDDATESDDAFFSPISTATAFQDEAPPGDGVEESKSSSCDEETATTGEEEMSHTQHEQPLVGYWNWENTIRSHKMKMHLAKGTDVALHVVLAVLVNQVRYERNALAMTV